MLEVVEDRRGNAYRAVYSVRYAARDFVLHVFQKKSRSGIATPKPDLELIKERLKAAVTRAKELEMGKRQSRSTAAIGIHEGSANVYADLGYPDAEEMLVKAKLVRKISEIVRGKGLTQVEIAKVLGLTQPKVSALLRGQFRGVSERKLIDCLTSLGRDVEIVVKDVPRRRDGGRVTVVFA